jgi:multidrug efflux pump subunit AcrA (membrane-fusion protein)
VPQSQIAALQAGARARIEVPSANTWFEAKSVTVVPTADPRTHTTRVRIDLKDDALAKGARGLFPGVFARAHFATGKVTRLMVPREAIVRRSEVTAVYVIDDKGAPQLRQVRLGTAADERAIEVLAGVKPGERVALDPVAAGMVSAKLMQ